MRSAGYRPRADCQPLRVQCPVDWGMDPFGDRNWRSQLNMLRLLDPLLRAFEQSKDASLLRAAFDYCLDWARYHGSRVEKNPFAWVDMVVGIRAQRLSHLCECLRYGLFDADDDERALFARMLAEHWRRLTSPGFFKYTNHTIVDIHGLTSLLRAAFPDSAAQVQWERAIGQHLDHALDLQFDEHGVHRENSPGYQFVAKNMFVALQRSGWYTRISPKLGRCLERAARVEQWMRMPDGRLVPLGDTDGEAPRQPPMGLRRHHSAQAGTIESLNHSCYCFVRRVSHDNAGEWSFLGIKAGFEVNTHRHHDEMSYVWSESGWDIVTDSGKYSYDKDDMRQYVRSSRAHNVIQFAGLDLNGDVAHRTGHLTKAIQEHPWGIAVGAEWTHQPLGIRQRRAFYFSPGRWLIVADEFQAKDVVSFVHRTQLAPEFSVKIARTQFNSRHESGAELGVDFWSSVPVQTRLHQGVRTPQIEGWISRSYRSSQPAPVLALEGRARQARLVMALSLDESASLEAPTGRPPHWRSADGAFAVEPHVDP
jgi:Heparinase II/III-like protein/Heparinase II/III N-terminus